MALPPIGSDELVRVSTEDFFLTIKGQAFHPSFPGVEIRDGESVFSVLSTKPFDKQFAHEPLQAEESFSGYDRCGKYKITPIFFEQQRYELILEPRNGKKLSFWHDNYNIRKQVTPVGSSGLMTGILNFGNEIGFSDLVILVDGQRAMKLTLEVFPSKISYREDYQAIVSDIIGEVYNLVFDFLKKTYNSFDITDSAQSSPVEFFAIIRMIYDHFVHAADMILRNPHHELRKEYEVQPFYKAKRIDNRSVRWAEKHTDQLMRSGDKVLAEKILAVRKYITYDTKENRLAKYMLIRTADRLRNFREQYCKLGRETDEAILGEIDGMINGIRRRCESGFMKEIHSGAENVGMSLVFSMAPGYRELFYNYLKLQHGLSVTGDLFHISLKDLAVLYEYWCFIKLNSLMKERYQLVSTDIIRVEGAGLFVSLTKGRSSRVHYLDPETGEHIRLSYNPKEIGTPTVTQRPDNVLRLEKRSGGTDYEYVFDAKYRINPALPGTDYYNTVSHQPGPEIGDINTMHRYRDAIVYQNDASPYERTMFGAYVLFPYHNEEEYRGHRFYQSIGKVNIGGLPFLPSATQLVSEMLDELVSDSPESAFERATLPRGIEKKLAKVNWNRRDVLIGTFSRPEQLEICLEHRFYHIPVKRVNKDNLPIRYVALYQTRTMFETDAGIEWYGEVLNYSIVHRNAITELPKDTDELYYRFEIREWKKLPKKLLTGEVGLYVGYTNLFLLEHSGTVAELFFRSEDQFRFYTELKRRTAAQVLHSEDSFDGFTFKDLTVSFAGGQILLLRDGKIIGRSSVSDFSHTPNAVFRRLMRSADGNHDM